MLYDGGVEDAKGSTIPNNPPLQPDQRIEAWASFVADYETLFEPLTDEFATAAFQAVELSAGARLLDIGCGPGGAALVAARRGADVLAVDASSAMVKRVAVRAREAGLERLRSNVMDAGRLDLPDASFDIAYSAFGIVLLPDPLVALREMRRILAQAGKAVVVTWTEPQNYELAARLRRAIDRVRGAGPAASSVPAQLRYADPAALRELMIAAGFTAPVIRRFEGRLIAPTADVLAGRLAFAPGMAAMLDALGDDRAAIVAGFTETLRQDFGSGQITLGAIAHAAIGGLTARA